MWVEAWLGPGFLTMSLGCLLLWRSVLPAKQSVLFSSSLSLLFKQSYSVDQPGLTLRYLPASASVTLVGKVFVFVPRQSLPS